MDQNKKRPAKLALCRALTNQDDQQKPLTISTPKDDRLTAQNCIDDACAVSA